MFPYKPIDFICHFCSFPPQHLNSCNCFGDFFIHAYYKLGPNTKVVVTHLKLCLPNVNENSQT